MTEDWAAPVYRPSRRPDDPFGAPSPWADPRPSPEAQRPQEPPDEPEPHREPEPPAAPPPHSERRSVLIGLLAAALIMIAVVGVGVALAVRDRGGPAAQAVEDAVRALAAAPGVGLQLTFAGPDGEAVDADLTFTSDGTGSGTITDPGGGRAEVRNSGLHTYVRADAAWWSRRAPEKLSGLAGRWIEPEPGVALPIGIGLALTPRALAGSIDSAVSGVDPKTIGAVDWRGRAADIVQYHDWTVAVTKTSPPSVVWLGGPLTDNGPLQPAGRSGGGQQVAIALAEPDGDALAQARAAVAELLTPAAAGLTSAGAPAPSAAPPAAPERVSQFQVGVTAAPRWAIRANAPACESSQCVWSVTVTNVGTATAEATVLAGVAPGTQVRTVPLGALQPGAWATTPVMTFANPGSVRYSVQVYSPTLDGPDPAPRKRLVALGVDPSQSPVVNELDPALQQQLLAAADLMTRGRTSLGADEPSQVVGALEWLVADRLLPDLQAIVASGRLDDPANLAARLGQRDARRAVELTASLLRADPAAHVRLGGAGAALTDVTNQRAYRILPDPAQAPPGPATTAVLYLEPTGPEHNLDRAGLEAFYQAPEHHRRLDDALCPGGAPVADELLIVNRAGSARWAKDRFHTLAAACP
ncbi:hypothetical protein GCM10022255_077790 [Dactylosporangium darangshiense]|uniref:Uncharacterized protein n=1 Tax=Dactylosporangium darangshiense TaxID=579108 RepID=A0ABP8DKS6_9ACTN